jgi:hypothetical protein
MSREIKYIGMDVHKAPIEVSRRGVEKCFRLTSSLIG